MNAFSHHPNRLITGIFIFILVCGSGIIAWNALSAYPDGVLAKDGRLDLPADKLLNTATPLDGHWAFAWGNLYGPRSFPAGDSAYMNLPRTWNGVLHNGERLPAHGVATYQLNIFLEPGHGAGDLALYIPFIHSSYALFLQDELVATDGQVGPSHEAYEPSARTRVVPVSPGTDTLSVTLQVANFAYSLGGVWQSPRLGTLANIQAHYDRQLAFDLFIFGGLFLMSIYHIALYFFRRKMKSNLYFGLLCFFLAIKNLFTGVAFFFTAFPGATYETGLKLIHISIFATMLLLWLFLRELFKSEFPLLVTRLLAIASGTGILATLVFSSRVYSQLMLPFWIISGIMVLFILRGIYLSVSKNKEGALLILAGILFFILTVLHDAAIDFKLIQSVYLAGAGFFLFIFSQSLLLAKKFTNSFRKVENLTEDLISTNKSFSRFVPSEYLSFLNKSSILDVALGDSMQRDMTVFFSDIRSYTSLSELMSPTTNFAFINDYFGRVVEYSHSNEGQVNQYLGDGILALFTGSPENAIRAAIEIQRDIADIKQLGGFQMTEPLRTGIGIHSGPLILGMMGTEKRMTPSVISDTVNTASRIEGLTKFFGAQIIVSGPSLSKIEDPHQFDFRFLGKVTVKGKIDSLNIYEILDGLPEAVRAMKVGTRADFEAGLNFYFERKFYEAKACFESVLEVNPDDLAARIYVRNSEEYYGAGVAEEWAGALKMELK